MAAGLQPDRYRTPIDLSAEELGEYAQGLTVGACEYGPASRLPVVKPLRAYRLCWRRQARDLLLQEQAMRGCRPATGPVSYSHRPLGRRVG